MLPRQTFDLPDAEVWLVPDFLAPAAADALLAALLVEIPWEDEVIQMFGQRHPVPRRVCWLGAPGVCYRYSGNTHSPKPWPQALQPLLPRIQQAAGAEQPFNGALANLYRDGADRMGWHADNEAELGPQPRIASLSLGAPRRFLLKHRQGTARLEVTLPHGSLLVMAGPTQQHWLHQLPATRRPTGERINLTFRRIVAGR